MHFFFFEGLARRVNAKILIASTSEVYGDPDMHPQPETYWGHVNPIGRITFLIFDYTYIQFYQKKGITVNPRR